MKNDEDCTKKDIDEGVARDIEYIIKCEDRIEEENSFAFSHKNDYFENFDWDQE
jgi:hypothetical protein